MKRLAVSRISLIVALLFVLLVLEYADGVQTEETIRNLLKPTSTSKKQGVFLADYTDNSAVLNWKDKVDQPDEAKPVVEEGEFFVRAPTNQGIMVVIQFLSLRTKFQGPSRKKLDEVCRDYIKISDSRSKETAEICGYLYVRDTSILPEKLLGPRTFYSSNGEVNIKVFIDKSTTAEMVDPLWNTLSIAVTAVSECGSDNVLPPTGNPSFRPCFPNTTITNDNIPKANCIPSSLFCDDIFQCGFEGQVVGEDEQGCAASSNTGKSPIKQGINNNGSSGSSVLMILCICIGVIIIAVFIGAYAVSELNVSCSSCPLGARLQRGSSNTRISKAADMEVSSASRTPSNYSSFTIEETRQK